MEDKNVTIFTENDPEPPQENTHQHTRGHYIHHRVPQEAKKYLPIILILVILFFIRLISHPTESPNKITPQNIPTTLLSPTPYVYETMTYKNVNQKYIVLAPRGWKITEENEAKQVSFTPTNDSVNMGTTEKITVTVVDKPAKNQPLTTEKEYMDWLTKDPETEIKDPKLYKHSNVFIDAQEAVVILDYRKPEEGWSVVTWIRKNDINYYINMSGPGKMEESEWDSYNFFVSSFKIFTPTEIKINK